MQNEEPTVYVVDDDPSVTRGLARLLKSAGYEVQTFASAREFLREYPSPSQRPACLVLDVMMPGINGLELQERLQMTESAMPIVFITGHGDIPMSVKVIKTGAINFLTKPFDEVSLLEAVEEALHRAEVIHREKNEQDSIHNRFKSLTPREYEILTYVITGMLNKQIAYTLDISEKTVKVHRGRVMEKLGVDSVAELVRLADKANVQPTNVPDS
jgi:FixJ family two-component response regulator